MHWQRRQRVYTAAMAVSLRTWIIPLTTLSLALTALGYVSVGLNEDRIGQYIRLTSGSSMLLFALAWSASSLNRLLPDGRWRPVLHARRRVGIAFAISHTFHLLGIIALVEIARGGNWGDFEALPGAAIYAVIYAMAFTSNDASVRLLGRNWKRLHTVGGLILWGAFTVSYIGKITEYGFAQHYLFSALCVALMVVRIMAWRKR